MTMAVVRLSSTEDMMNVIRAMIHNFVPGRDMARNQVETFVRVNPFDDGHGAQQIKKNLGDIT